MRNESADAEPGQKLRPVHWVAWTTAGQGAGLDRCLSKGGLLTHMQMPV